MLDDILISILPLLDDALVGILPFIAFGAFMDRVFVGQDGREKTSVYLQSNNEHLSPNERFSIFLQRGHDIVFGRFFSSKFLSFRFMISAIIVSLISFSIVVLVQVYLFPDQFLSLKVDSTQILLFSVFIVFNICFDYFTIIQTKVFVDASIKTKSTFRSILFIGSDLIVTFNTFILSYAIFILIVVQWVVWTPVNVSFAFQERLNPVEISFSEKASLNSKYENQAFVNEIKYQHTVYVIFVATDQVASYASINLYSNVRYESSNNFDTGSSKLGFLIAKLSSLNFSIQGVDNMPTREKIRKQFRLEENVDPIYTVFLEGDSFTTFSSEVDGSVWKDGNANEAYIASFNITDSLEDDFPTSITNSLELLSLSQLIKNTIAPQDLDNLVYCFDSNESMAPPQPSVDLSAFLEECGDFIMFDHSQLRILDQELSVIGRDIDDYRVLFNSLLITSILPTVFFYLSVTFLAISIALFSGLVNRMSKVKKYFLRAPFSVSGFLLGVIISAISIVVSG